MFGSWFAFCLIDRLSGKDVMRFAPSRNSFFIFPERRSNRVARNQQIVSDESARLIGQFS
jgi:hypothetical protein